MKNIAAMKRAMTPSEDGAEARPKVVSVGHGCSASKTPGNLLRLAAKIAKARRTKLGRAEVDEALRGRDVPYRRVDRGVPRRGVLRPGNRGEGALLGGAVAPEEMELLIPRRQRNFRREAMWRHAGTGQVRTRDRGARATG